MPSSPSRALGPRVERLEARVDSLDHRMRALEGATPGDAGAEVAAGEPQPDAPRCPGCHLEVEDPSARRCRWCGFVFSAARPRRTRRG